MITLIYLTMVLNIAHRGASLKEPENTMRAFREAKLQGADMIELDVHLTQDGHLAVIHDGTVDRTTDGSGRVSNMKLSELKDLDAGKGERIPALSEVLEGLGGEMGFNIELKGRGTACHFHENMVRYLKKVPAGDVILSSFSPLELVELKERSSPLQRAVLIDGIPSGAEEFAMETGCMAVHPNTRYLESSYIELCHDMGLKVNVWTVNDISRMEQLIGYGADGLITDRPDSASKLIRQIPSYEPDEKG